MTNKRWAKWIRGVVLAYRVERFHVSMLPQSLKFILLSGLIVQVGMEVELYDVQTEFGFTGTYIPFTGEVRDGVHYCPSDSSQEMMQRVADMVSQFPSAVINRAHSQRQKRVFACIQTPTSDGRSAPIWTAAIVMVGSTIHRLTLALTHYLLDKTI